MERNTEDCPEVLLAVEEISSWWKSNRGQWAEKIEQVKNER